MEQVAESEPAQLPEPVMVPDDFTLFTTLTRPMPDYALQHVFSTHGTIEWVRADLKSPEWSVCFLSRKAMQSGLQKHCLYR